MSELMTTTYSMWRLFRNCRMACKWRYIDELVPLECSECHQMTGGPA